MKSQRYVQINILILIVLVNVHQTLAENPMCIEHCDNYTCENNLECLTQLNHCQKSCANQSSEGIAFQNCVKGCLIDTYPKADLRSAIASAHCHLRCFSPPRIGYFHSIAAPSQEVFKIIPGWKLHQGDQKKMKWDLKWSHKYSIMDYDPELPVGRQIANKIGGFAELLGDKLGMMTTLEKYDQRQVHARMPQSVTFWPETTVIDITQKEFSSEERQFFETEKDKKYWIIKQPSGYGGEGLVILESKDQVKKLVEKIKQSAKGAQLQDTSILIQKYIENPLLINRQKFDIRAFMLIVSTDPYLVLFHNGYVRKTLVNYNLEIHPWGKRQQMVHLTNTHMQSRHPDWALIQDTHSFTFEELQNFLKTEYKQTQYELNQHWTHMKKILTYSFLASQDYLEKRKGAFHLTGNDFMMDENFNLSILELNQNPRLQLEHNGERNTVPNLVKDVLDFVLMLNDRQDELHQLLKEPHKHFNFKDWEILYNQATGYNYIDDPQNHIMQ